VGMREFKKRMLNISAWIYWPFVLLLLKNVVQVMCPFINWIVCSFSIQFFELLYVLDNNPLSEK
jgi:hypothetical protein